MLLPRTHPALWFTNSGRDEGSGVGDSIGRITTEGTITIYRDQGGYLSYPLGITSGSDGALWFTNGSGVGIGRVTTQGAVTYYNEGIDSNYVGGSLGLPVQIAAGPDGALWFTTTRRSGPAIGRISTGSGRAILYVLADRPYGIAAGPDRALWFTSTSGNSIGRITTRGTARIYKDKMVRGPWGIASGPDRAVWFTMFNGRASAIGRVRILKGG